LRVLIWDEPVRKRMISGINYTLSTIIIISITILISIVFVSWITNYWNIHESKYGQAIQIYPDSYFDKETNSIYLHIKTHIDPAAKIWIEVPGFEIINFKIVYVISGNPKIYNGYVFSPIGSDFWIEIKIAGNTSNIQTVYFKLYTEKGYVYWGSVSTIK
jgi:type IV secretory pathway VirB3-like protein